MAENSNIEWTDHTFNPWRGCTKVHEGCANCYAEAQSKRNPGVLGIWGPNGKRVAAAESYWKQPEKWNRQAEAEGVRKKVFCASLADVFEDWDGPILSHEGDTHWKCSACGWSGLLPVVARELSPSKDINDCPSCGGPLHWVRLDDLRRRLFALIDATPNLDWLLLTKRPENMRRMWPSAMSAIGCVDIPWRSNVWLLTSISTQEHADQQIPELLKCHDLVPVLGLSIEPLLGPIDLNQSWKLYRGDGWKLNCNQYAGECPTRGLDWVIVGGESGPNARPMHPQWARDIRDQCTASGVPFFFKQWGEWLPFDYCRHWKMLDVNYGEFHEEGDFIEACMCEEGTQGMFRVGKKTAGRLLDGQTWSEFPTCKEAV